MAHSPLLLLQIASSIVGMLSGLHVSAPAAGRHFRALALLRVEKCILIDNSSLLGNNVLTRCL
jgi:hypothetical protein